MYGLLQAGILANKLLKERLARHEYFKELHTPGLWKHVTHPVWFNQCVNNFGIKYIGCKHLQHLYNALRKETYEIVEDWTGDLYCRITLDGTTRNTTWISLCQLMSRNNSQNTVTLLP
jgi:hypothetical protein